MTKGKKTGQGKNARTMPPRIPTPPVAEVPVEVPVEVEDPLEVPVEVPAGRVLPPLPEENTAPQKKKARKSVTMSATEEKDLVDFIQQNPCLYDKSKRDWLKTVRDELWRTQAEVMQRPREELTLWYESIRTRFSRLRKTKSGQGAVRITDRDQWILDNFSFLISHMIEVPRRNTVSMYAKATAAAAAPLAAASTSTSVEVIPDDCILDVQGMPDIPPIQPTSESFEQRRPSHTERTTTSHRGKKRPTPGADDSTSTDKRAIDEMQSQREQSSELAQLSRDLLQTIRPTTSLDKHHMCGYLSSQFNEVRPEIWKRYRARFFLLCEEMVAENDAANAAERQSQPPQQQPQKPLERQPLQQQQLPQQQPLQRQPLQQQQPQQQQPQQQQPFQQQQHVQNEWQPPPSQWGTQTYPGVTPWNSMDYGWVQRTFPTQTVTRSSPRSPSCPPFRTPTLTTLNTPQLPSQGSASRISFNDSFSSLLNQNRDSQDSVVDQVVDDQQSDDSDDQPPSDDQ